MSHGFDWDGTICRNYKKESIIRAIVERKNQKEGYDKYALDIIPDNCDDCDRWPSLMFMKICFELDTRSSHSCFEEGLVLCD